MVRLVARKPEVLVWWTGGDESELEQRSESGDLRLHASIPLWEGVSDVRGGERRRLAREEG